MRADRAGRGTPCKLTFVGMSSEASGRSLLRVLCPQAAASPVAILFERLSCLPGTEARLQHVAVGGGKLVCCSAIWPVEPIFYSLTLVATQESHCMDRRPSLGPALLSQKFPGPLRRQPGSVSPLALQSVLIL